MRALLYAVLAAQLLASCDTQGSESAQLPTERALVVASGDSLFAVSLGDPSTAVTVGLGAGRFRVVGAPTEGNQLTENGTVLLVASDRRAADAPTDRIVRVSARSPEQPVILGNPAESIYQAYVSASRIAYALTQRNDSSCRGWAVVRLGEGTTKVIACIDALPAITQPQSLFVSEDEAVILVSFFPERLVIGNPMDIAVLRPSSGSGIEIYREVTPAVYDVRYRASSGALYFIDFYTGAVYSLAPGNEGPVIFRPALSSRLSGRRLFLLDDVLLTYQRREGQGTTTVYTMDLSTGAEGTFEIPGEMVQAYEHGGYILFRPFDFGGSAAPVETFVGLCASGLGRGRPVQVETFEVSLPAFAQETALLSHSLRCTS